MRWSEIEANEPNWLFMLVILILVSGTGGVVGMLWKSWGFATLTGAVVGAVATAIALTLCHVDLAENTVWIAVAAGCCAVSAFKEANK